MKQIRYLREKLGALVEQVKVVSRGKWTRTDIF